MTDFEAVVRAHTGRYPKMQPQDYGKLAYQSEFGAEHMIADEQSAAAYILSEWQSAKTGTVPCNPEPVGNGLCRFHMTAGDFSPDSAAELARLFIQSAREHTGTREGLDARFKALQRLPIDGMEQWLSAWCEQGCPPVHHSEVFRAAYRPHYRILREELTDRLIRSGR